MSHSLKAEGDTARNEGGPPGHPGGQIGSNTCLPGTMTVVRLLAGGPSLAQIGSALGHKVNAGRGNAPTHRQTPPKPRGVRDGAPDFADEATAVLSSDSAPQIKGLASIFWHSASPSSLGHGHASS